MLGGLSFARVSAGASHSCGVTTADIAYCWGSDAVGQVGDGNPDFSEATPTPVAGGLNFARVRAGNAHSCGVTADNVAYCWGLNESGQLGDGTFEDRSNPTPVVQ